MPGPPAEGSPQSGGSEEELRLEYTDHLAQQVSLHHKDRWRQTPREGSPGPMLPHGEESGALKTPKVEKDLFPSASGLTNTRSPDRAVGRKELRVL